MTKRPRTFSDRQGTAGETVRMTQAIGSRGSPGRAGAQGMPGGDDDPRRTAVLQPAMAMAMAAASAREDAPVPMPPTPRPPPSDRPAPEIGLAEHRLSEDVADDPRLVLVSDPDSDRAAAFRVLRHHLLEVGRPQVVVVSSARAGEGKTLVAINLALALAECGRAKVLLVESHVRRPELASLFGFAPPWCFAEQLAAHRHQPSLPWSLVALPELWLHVAAINPDIERNQLLDAPAFAIAMDSLRQAGYDHIVIDGPPVLGSADVNLIQDAADGVLLTLRSRTTTARELREAIEQLTPAKIIGSVMIER